MTLSSSVCFLRGWHRADFKFLIIFVSSLSCPHRAGTGRLTTEAFYFLLGSYSVSTLVSLVHLDFSLPFGPRPSGPLLGQHLKRRNDKSLCPQLTALSPRVENFVVINFSDAHSSFRHLTQAIHLVFLLSFVYLTTQVHPVFEIHELTRPVESQNVTLDGDIVPQGILKATKIFKCRWTILLEKVWPIKTDKNMVYWCNIIKDNN